MTGSIGHILTNTIDLSVMGLLRTARALFSQKKAVSRRQREDQPEAGGSRDQTRYRRGVTTRVEWIQM